MIKHGEAPYLECSTAGDSRFSAFCAMVDGKTIEERYQAFKVFEDGATGLHWRQAKGRKAVNAEQAGRYYAWLWRSYINEHPELLDTLLSASGLSDRYGQTGHACQATELWNIRAWHLKQINLLLWGW